MKTIKNFALLVLLIKLSACANSKAVPYLQGSFDTARLGKYQLKEPIIQKGDLLGITIYSDDAEATALYNLPNQGGTQSDRNTAGYLVDNAGNIQLQQIGSLHVEGLSKPQLSEMINSKLLTVLKNPYNNIRFLNYKVTLVGEVIREGVYTVPDERVDILEAVGLAGGLTANARKENILVIRQTTGGKREFARLDLTKPEALESPYFYLEQNDMIIVDPVKNKSTPAEEKTVRNISILTSIVSTLAIVYSLLHTN